jgi:F0F1-type ATP synthase epsilon subunit
MAHTTKNWHVLQQEDQTAWWLIHTGSVDTNSHQGTLGVLDHHLETMEHGITWY